MTVQSFDHRHLVLNAHGLAWPVVSAAALSEWLLSVVAAVGMKVLDGPHAVRCDTPGNEGVTGTVVIETSHASIHIWESKDAAADGPFLRFDLYSCKTFGTGAVARLLIDAFGPAFMSWHVVDRNGRGLELIEEGSWEPAPQESSPGVLLTAFRL